MNLFYQLAVQKSNVSSLTASLIDNENKILYQRSVLTKILKLLPRNSVDHPNELEQLIGVLLAVNGFSDEEIRDIGNCRPPLGFYNLLQRSIGGIPYGS